MLIAFGWVGTIWLVLLPYRLSPFALQLSRVLVFAVLVFFVLGLGIGTVDAIRRKDKLGKWFSVFSAFGALAGLVFFTLFYVGAHASVSAKNQCINNLRELDRIIEQIASEWNLEAGTKVPESEILRRLNNTKLNCPEGGTYSYGIVGEAPKCSVPGHKAD